MSLPGKEDPAMGRYVIRRILWALVLFFAVTLVTYLIFFVIPVDPARLAAGQRATPDEVARARQFLGLNEPVPVQSGRFVWRLTYHHSLGRSFSNRQDVRDPLLGLIRTHDPVQRDGRAGRGLRADRGRKGGAAGAGAGAARAADRAAADRDHGRDGHRDRARRRDLHRADLRPARPRLPC